MRTERRGAFLNTREAAAWLEVNPQTLIGWRRRGEGPAFLRLGTSRMSRVRYLPADLAAWLASRRHGGGAEQAEQVAP